MAATSPLTPLQRQIHAERPGMGGSLQARATAKRAPISHPETLQQVPNLPNATTL